MPESDLAATRRQFLGFLAASPALALAGTGTGLVQRLLAATTDGASHAQQADLVASATEALSVFDFQAVARQVLPTAHYAYLATSVDDDRMLEVNREGFRQFQLRMRRLVDVRTIDTSVDIFGSRWETPIVIQPTGSNGAFHPDAELAVARAAKAKGHLQMLSTVASTPIEEVIAARGGPIWFQLYAATDWTLTEAMVRRAEAAGAAAVVLTVDLQAGSNRLTALRGIRADDRDCALCHDPDQPRAMHTHLDPSSFVTGGRPPRTGPSRPVGMTWDYVTRLKNATSMKVLVKGIVTGEDASLSEASWCRTTVRAPGPLIGRRSRRCPRSLRRSAGGCRSSSTAGSAAAPTFSRRLPWAPPRSASGGPTSGASPASARPASRRCSGCCAANWRW